MTTVGANVYQPWSSTAAADQIGDNVRTGTMDATIAAPNNTAHVVYEIEGIGAAVYETTTPVLGMAVEKSGATTEHTTGSVVAVNLTKTHIGSTNDFEVDPDTGQARFAYYGDSGSLIVERTNPSGSGWKRVVGLLWGGDPSLGNAYGHPIEDVFADLDLTTVCSGAIAEVFDSAFARSFGLEPAVDRVLARSDVLLRSDAALRSDARVLPERLTPIWRRTIRRVSRHRGFTRELEGRIKRTDRGQRLTEIVHRNRVAIAQLVLERESRRVLEAAAAPFLDGIWSAKEVMSRVVTDEDSARFNRALKTAAESRPELEELVAEARALLEELPGRSLGEVLG